MNSRKSIPGCLVALFGTLFVVSSFAFSEDGIESPTSHQNKARLSKERAPRAWKRNPLLANAASAKIESIAQVEDAVIENGCDTNLCFALQGGDDVTDAEYLDQQNFVDIIISIVATDTPANYAGVQYHSTPTIFSYLTGNQALYYQRLYSTSRIPGGTNIASGIRFCGRTLRPRVGDAKKMVVLGNGFATVGKNQIRAAKRFLMEGGDLCAVTVGPADLTALEELTGNPARIVNIDQYFELAEIIVGVVEEVCNIPAAARVSPVSDSMRK